MSAVDRGLTCRHFGTCGGCSLLDVPYTEQLATKVAQTHALLAPFLGNIPLEPLVPPHTPRHYRTDVLLPVHPHPSGLTMGLYRRGTHRVVEIDECRIQVQALTLFQGRARDLFRKLRLPPYREQRGTGLLRAFRARYLPGSGALIAGLVTTDKRLEGIEGIVAGLRAAATGLRDPEGRPLELCGVVQNYNPGAGNRLLGSEERALWGRPGGWDAIQVGDRKLELRVSFSSFYQAHRHGGRLLWGTAFEMLGDVTGKRLVDGYGGVGSAGFRAALHGAQAVEIVENHPLACQDARATAARAGLTGVRVREEAFAESAFFADPDVLIVDPPRAGLGSDGVARALAAGAALLLYVSCSAKALARDLEKLGAGYRVRAARYVDLFPHTEHGEVLVLLEGKGA